MVKDKLSILLIAPIPPPAGGDSTWTYKYLKYCKENNYAVYHVNTSMIGKRSLSTSDSIKIFDEIKRCIQIWKGIRLSIKDKQIPKIAHMNTNCSPRGIIRDYISSLIISKHNIPLVLHCRCNVKDQIGDSSLGLFIFKKIIKNCARVLVQNSYSKDYVSRFAGSKVLYMQNYIEAEYVKDTKIINEEIKNVLYVGHIRKTKGIDEILQCATTFPDKNFYLAGPITNDYSINDFKKYNNVYILGSLSEDKIKEQLDNADLFLFPSYTEGFSNAVLEAMARGVPIVTTNVGANKEMLENHGGFLCPIKNVKKLSEAIKSISEKSKRIEMSKWNINKVLRNYTIDAVMKILRSLYMEILDECN